MRPETAEWVEKAEGDWRTAAREAAVVDFPNPDAVCFHAQQCAEKYLKALLVEGNVRFPKTHHLPSLLDLAKPLFPAVERLRDEAARLAPYAVNLRYPSDGADVSSAEEALGDGKTVSAFCRSALGLID